jgi:NAD(P)-dependent dehydrogenase (short-subunit alcohol dehydrogenase family)
LLVFLWFYFDVNRRKRVKNKVCLITGGASGMGRIVAKTLAEKGASTIIVDKDSENGEKTAAEITQSSTGNTTSFYQCDLALLKEVRELAQSLESALPKIDVLINNAGIIVEKREETLEGFERTFATNYLGHFLLTNLLLPQLKQSGSGRIISISSDAHKGCRRLDFDDLNNRKKWNKPSAMAGNRAYQSSKLCIVYFTHELARRLEGSTVTANAVHPGAFVDTNIYENMTGFFGLIMKLLKPFYLPVEKGAETALYLASSPEVEGASGNYFAQCTPKQSSKVSYDRAAARRLWSMSEEMTRLKNG